MGAPTEPDASTGGFGVPHDARLISLNDHVVETPRVWSSRLTGTDPSLRPHVARVDHADHWRIGSVSVPVADLNLRHAEDPNRRSADMATVHPGLTGAADRLALMDADGVHAHTLLPTVIGFAGERLAGLGDPQAWADCVRAYNDHLLEEVCAEAPERLLAVAVVPLGDPTAAAAELQRAVTGGARAVSFPADPAACGGPSWYDDAWHRLFALAEEAQIAVLVHIGTPTPAIAPSAAPSPGSVLLRSNLDALHAAIDLACSPVLDHHPGLRVVLVEAGLGWLPFLEERVAFFARRAELWPARRRRSPLEALREQVGAAFISDPYGIAHRDAIGVERIYWSSDFPHFDSPWPHSRVAIGDELARVPEAQAHAIVAANAASLLGVAG